MPFLDLRSDFAFRALFTRSPNSLIHLVNAALDFQGDRQIREIDILPSANPKETVMDKLSILDIKAVDQRGELLNIEMQAFPQSHYPERSLFYWAKLLTGQLSEGDGYDRLRGAYSINFLDFILIRDRPSFKSHFVIAERDDPSLILTDLLQMVFIELPKFNQELKKIDDSLGSWLYLIKNAPVLKEADMKILVERNPVMRETLDVLGRISIDPKLLSAEEARRKALSDYNTNIKAAEDRGIEKGKLEDARAMLEDGLLVEKVAQYTNLTEEQLREAGLIG